MTELVVRVYENGGRRSVSRYHPEALAEICSAIVNITDKQIYLDVDDEVKDLRIIFTDKIPSGLSGSLIRIMPLPVRQWSEYVQLHFIDPAMLIR